MSRRETTGEHIAREAVRLAIGREWHRRISDQIVDSPNAHIQAIADVAYAALADQIAMLSDDLTVVKEEYHEAVVLCGQARLATRRIAAMCDAATADEEADDLAVVSVRALRFALETA